MSLKDLVGSTYGPYPARVAAEQVAAYVAVTGDDATRWVKHAPPSYAGALLFVAARSFLNAADVKPYTKLLVHADQTFTWHRALEIDEPVMVDGALTRVRSRGSTSFVTFESFVRSGDEAVIAATSTFLMGDGAPAAEPEEEAEPPVDERGPYQALPVDPRPTVGPLPEIVRSASRLDLVRYAAASGDFNPVHFDQETARRAGFPGVLVHGLLMGAWLVQYAAACSGRTDPVAFAKLRFRSPLRPAVAATLSGGVTEVSGRAATLRLALRDQSTEYVQGTIDIRTA